MKKLAILSILLVTLTGCNSTPFINHAIVPQNTRVRSFTNDQDLVKIVERNTTELNKQKVIEKLMQNQITLKDADIFDKKNIYRIEFSNGYVQKVPGFLRMYLRPSGISEIQLVGNFYNNKPVELSLKESSVILKSAENYKEHRLKLDKILD